MTIYAKIITLAAVLVALAVGAQAQTPEIDALRVLAEQGDVEAVRLYRLAADQGYARTGIRLLS